MKDNNPLRNLLARVEKIRRKLERFKNCKYCGKLYFPKSNNSKYCSEECAKEVEKKQALELNRKYRERKRVTYNYKCNVCGKDFVAVYLAASLIATAEENRRESKRKLETVRPVAKPIIRLSPELYHNTCPICGKKFSTTLKDKIFCSKECKYEDDRRKNPPVIYNKKCNKCGAEFRTTKRMVGKCPQCRAIEQGWIINFPAKPIKPPAPKKGESNFERRTREARECGMDYGNYVAQLNFFGKTYEELKAKYMRKKNGEEMFELRESV